MGKIDHMAKIASDAEFPGIEPMNLQLEAFRDPLKLKDTLAENNIELSSMTLVCDWKGPKETEEEFTAESAIPKTVKAVKEAPGKMVRMTLSALLKEPEDGPRAVEELKRIEDLLKQAVGYKEERDSITVEQFKFAPVEIAAVQPVSWDEVVRTALPVAGLVVLVIVAAVMLFISMRRPVVTKGPIPKAVIQEARKAPELSAAELGIVDVESVGTLPPEEQRRIKLKEQIVLFAEQKPQEVAQIIKTWLAE